MAVLNVDNMLYETVNCNLCGSNEYRLYRKIRNTTPIDLKCWNVVECKHCGLRFTNPRLTIKEITKLYHECNVPTKHLTTIHRVILFLRKIKISLTRKIDNNLGNSILDVGCGEGIFLANHKAKSYDVYGLDLNEHLAQAVYEECGIKVFVGELSDIKDIPKKFHHITMYHSLEHSYDPSQDIKTAYKLLHDDGKIYIEVPNSNSIDVRWKIFKDYSVSWSLPFHTFHFTEASLSALLEKSGFRITKVKYPVFLPHAYSCALIRSVKENINPEMETFFLIALFPFTFWLSLFSSFFKKSAYLYVEAVKNNKNG
ncbi:MAG: hypothetical protein DRR16_07805 [Candidatus Parabeggiatoa sp. nov. 3]|nr:MAG: hypothetical protein DRR00_30655 [Gammaproteobacteria bacterium]RKZ87205.1 MAG: hypothetical protein DRR16_07805 [Gammaproteobacteria bacterium]